MVEGDVGWYLGNSLTIMSLLYIHGCPGVPAYVGWVPRYLVNLLPVLFASLMLSRTIGFNK